MKTLFRSASLFVISLFALCLAPVAHAQYNITTLISGTTNVIPAQSSNVFSSTATIAAVRGRFIVLQATFAMNTTGGTSNLFLKFDSSPDAANFSTNIFLWTFTPGNFVGTQTVSTNLDMGALGYLRLNNVINSNSTVVTNFTFKYIQKPGL